MDSLRYRRKAVPASLDMKSTKQFLPQATFVHKRISDTTDFDDTDFEFSDTEEESPRMSMSSFGYDSNSSLSTPDLPTPDNAPREPFSWKFDKRIEGPTGPHLFRDSILSSRSVPTTEIDLYFERSPVRTHFAQSDTETPSTQFQFSKSETETPNSRDQFSYSETATPNSRDYFSQSETETSSMRYQFSPRTPKAYTTLQPDVSHVQESEIRGWSPSQVAHWMFIAGYDDSVIEKFIMNDITGSVLLSLQTNDLKELGIKSFGKRHQLMGSIDYLRNTMLKDPVFEQPVAVPSPDHSPKRRSYTMSVSPTGEVLSSRVYDGSGNQITPAESVSIVGIEQVLPKPHSCSKGENCPKYRKRQRQLERLAAEFPGAVILPGGSVLTGNPGNPETAKNLLRPKSDAEPSVVASSDILGPAQQTPRLCEEALSEVGRLDPQENVRQFLSYQHVEPPTLAEPEPVQMPENPAPALSPPTTYPNHMAANLRNLPKLTIPTGTEPDELTTATTATAQRTITPSMVNRMYGSPTAVQEYGPFSTVKPVGSDDFYRQGTPFSEMDVPVLQVPDAPVAREASQSVPPDMRYGNLMNLRPQEPIMRPTSTRPRATAPLRRVHEDRPLTPIEGPSDLIRSPRMPLHTPSSTSSLASDPDVTKSGWMKKRKQTRFLRHEWQDAHFTLRGTNLAMHKDELDAHRNSKALEVIDVDEYAVACSSLATSSKLTAAFKRSILRSGQNTSRDDAAFAFSLIPASKENEKKLLFANHSSKSHHFAVKSRDERIDWMRELMLAKALKKGREMGAEMQVNGNFI
ncbi:hypothetical protein KXW98_008256 [Aspergillus fumigatus]|nr:hypothetical protein KXX30_008750 [Aspergillus fumigatus]KAH1330235.1 hypothetical protein KXX47_006015 [Aspergillus fumigatus]KAH1367962.1 hypothetical protein KXX14_004117 [Aspergillus fumigatus]KAH1368228.1 hypothetical protein KXX63_000301 [Aspergillus fumigatus]KAH1387396.1 hypothetical protein KXX10_002967 [Aspergillus fumigatus]